MASPAPRQQEEPRTSLPVRPPRGAARPPGKAARWDRPPAVQVVPHSNAEAPHHSSVAAPHSSAADRAATRVPPTMVGVVPSALPADRPPCARA